MKDNQEKKIQGQKIKELFDLCCDQPKDQQEPLLSNSDYSEDIKVKVRKLLQYNSKDIELTEAIIDSVQVSLDVKPIKSGMKIGSYVLQHVIGEGGQGEVWLAHRKEGDFNHKVAIKFLKPVHDQKDLIRFQNERELLATLKHANIAQLLDGGELADNRPYMVLELIEGLPIIEYIQNKKLGIKAQLLCFLQISQAISYAHSHSVIHRDIKPSNVLVTNDGVVKLIDFGIAKFLDKEETKTQTLPIMTLAYSSPEQVTGATISTATDIYTLGLLLYEMLTGQRAQAVHTDVPFELIHEITEQTPTLPSRVIPSIDYKRIYLNKQLKGDLDNLILMAVRKEPHRRYPTANAMAKDVKNYLDNKPLMAVGDSWLYKTQKFITRNPTVSALSLLLIGFMIALPLVLISNQEKIKSQRDLALAAEKKEHEQSVIATRTTDFLVNILESASPLGNKGEAIYLDDVLLNAERQLSLGLDNQPKIKANLLTKLASINHHLSKEGKSIEYYLDALKIYEQQNDEIQKLYILGQLAITYHFNGEYKNRDIYKTQAIQQSLKITDQYELGWHQARMATLAFFVDDFDYINETTPKTLALLNQNKIDDPDLLGRLYNELALAQNGVNDEQALSYMTTAMNFAEIKHGKMYPKYQSRRATKATILMKLHRYDEAEVILLKSLEDAKKLYTKKHKAYSLVLERIGSYYHDKGRFTETEKIYKEAVDITMNAGGKDNANYVVQINNLAYLYDDSGQFEQAVKLFRESLILRKIIYGEKTYRVATSRANLARSLAKVGEFDEAKSLLAEAMPIYDSKNKTNLYNEITLTAIEIGDLSNKSTCITGLRMIDKLIPKVNEVSEKSWHRMNAELWLGELAHKCQGKDTATQLLKAAKVKSKSIYADNSDGQKLIQNKVDSLLRKL
jgi:serine/threonine protein kinase/tetratricopeptide (TPR) repeat protein